ncbi:macrophage mannose receptor 1-like [Garra rufa]|uniref:macrophage mannose receptor 1-like n=1 Tax=Garra rufa TaxID=137080 RepID=UPI003CCEB4F7
MRVERAFDFAQSAYLNRGNEGGESFDFVQGAYLNRERFIHVSESKMSWEKGLNYCNGPNKTAGLLRIESQDDQIETERELERQKISGPVWVGLRQSRLFGFWIWSNGLFVGPWTNWRGGSAPEHQMSQHCGAIQKVNAFPPSNAKGRLRVFHRGVKDVIRTDAVNECKTNYTDLVTVYDQHDNMELSTLVSNAPANPSGWIGAYIGNRSKKCSNGDEVTYNQSFNMNCGETCCAAMKADGNWEAVQCSENKTFMCYKDVGRASYNYTLITEKKSWFEAQLHCRENHTDLVSIRNAEENERVKKARNENTDPFWIGLLEDSVEWNDGGQSAYRNWKSEYLQSQKTEAYMVKDEYWVKNNGEHYSLCYKSLIHVSSSNMSWEKALDYCNSQPNTSGLLRIESRDDHIEIERELKRQKISGPVWVGLRQSRLFGFWIWYNGLRVGPWTNWKGGSAPEHQISEHCGAIEKVNAQYKWCDKDCRSEFRVLCEGK